MQQVATIHRRLNKEATKQNKIWVREIKQLLPKSPGSPELELVSAPAQPNRHKHRTQNAVYFSLLRKRQKLIFNLQQLMQRPTAHQMPAPARLYRRKPVKPVKLAKEARENSKRLFGKPKPVETKEVGAFA